MRPSPCVLSNHIEALNQVVTCVVESVMLISCRAEFEGEQIQISMIMVHGASGSTRQAVGAAMHQGRRSYLGVPSRPLPRVVVPDQKLPNITQRAALEGAFIHLPRGKGLRTAIAEHHAPGAGRIPHDVNVDLRLSPCAGKLRRDHRHQVGGAHGPRVVPQSGQQPLQLGASLHNTDPVVAVKVPDL